MDWATSYSQLMQWAGGGGVRSDTVLHIHGGMAIMLIVRVVTGRSLATPWPLLAVATAAFAKELTDYLAYNVIKPDTVSDFAHTVFWPAVLFTGLRLRRLKQPSKDQNDPVGRPSDN